MNFPEDYQAEQLAGKAAEFDVTVREVRAPKEATADDALAERLGLADLTPSKLCARTWTPSSSRPARFKLKRALLDVLDERHDFPLPPRMVDAEFGASGRRSRRIAPRATPLPRTRPSPTTSCAAEYRKIAERRVRLGLVLAEIGRRANIQVTEEEMSDAMRRGPPLRRPGAADLRHVRQNDNFAPSSARRSTRRRWSTTSWRAKPSRTSRSARKNS